MIYDSIVIGGGPAGLAATLSLFKLNKNVLLLEREARLGGILKQCIHDGFGLTRFKERLTGPEYAERFIKEIEELNVPYKVNAFVSKINKTNDGIFHLMVSCKEGYLELLAKTIVLSTGCRERTSKQVFLMGTRPYGVMTAGQAQALININGVIPGTKAVILGSGDIGLIMARRLTLSGVNVEGVYEIKNTPSGLTRNIQQCLNDYNIPLHLSTTVKECFGSDLLTGVTVSKLDNEGHLIKESERHIDCDLLILSVGLIPENELAESLGVIADPNTHGPLCDNGFETNVKGVFTCGNACQVHDLVDYVSESAESCARSIAYQLDNNIVTNDKDVVNIDKIGKILSIVPQQININSELEHNKIYYRVKSPIKEGTLKLIIDDNIVYNSKVRNLLPASMEGFNIDLSKVKSNSKVILQLEEGEQ